MVFELQIMGASHNNKTEEWKTLGSPHLSHKWITCKPDAGQLWRFRGQTWRVTCPNLENTQPYEMGVSLVKKKYGLVNTFNSSSPGKTRPCHLYGTQGKGKGTPGTWKSFPRALAHWLLWHKLVGHSTGKQLQTDQTFPGSPSLWVRLSHSFLTDDAKSAF